MPWDSRRKTNPVHSYNPQSYTPQSLCLPERTHTPAALISLLHAYRDDVTGERVGIGGSWGEAALRGRVKRADDATDVAGLRCQRRSLYVICCLTFSASACTIVCMEPLATSTPGVRRAAAFQIDVRNCCAPLPKTVRDKWKGWESAREANRDTSLEDLVSRLKRAEERRQVAPPSSSDDVLQVRRKIAEQKAVREKRLEEKLEYAAAKRQLRLEHVRSKAAAMLQRSELVAERVNERQELLAQKLYMTLNAAETRRLALIEAEKERLSAAHELVVSKLAQVQEREEQEREETKKQLGAKQVQADNIRSAILAATSIKAGDKVRHAKHVSKMRRLNEERDSELKRSCIDGKLQTAAVRRHEVCTVRVAINAEKSETQFLKRQATKRETLRRSGSSRLVQNSWLSFKCRKKTTKELALAVLRTGVTFLSSTLKDDETTADDATPPVDSAAAELKDPFDEFASRLQSSETINATKALLSRMKMKLLGKSKGTHDCASLLKRLNPRTPKSRLERYPTRVFLCAYMILNHPGIVFNAKGEREAALSASSKDMIESFERLVQRYLQPVNESATSKPSAGVSDSPSFSELFNAFDDYWVAYLEQFVAWKLHDAAGLADSLVRMAGKMQLSMLRKVEGDIHSEKVQNNSDLTNIVKQVQHDHQLLRERVERLTGEAGLKSFDAALEAARQKYQMERNSTPNENSDEVEESDASSSAPRKNSEREGSSRRSGDRRSGSGERWPKRRPSEIPDDGFPANDRKEAFVWELLYNRNYQLESEMIDQIWSSALTMEETKFPTPVTGENQLAPKALQKRITAIAEKAFWDSVEDRLSSESGGAAFHVCTMLLEIGSDLSATLPNTASAKIVIEHLKNEGELMKLLQGEDGNSNNLNTAGLLHLLEHTSELLRECGSVARNDEAKEAQQRVRDSIVEALESGERKALAKAICRALRLLYAQLKVLRFDLANAHIRYLSSALTGATAIKYGQDKFSSTFGLVKGQNPIDKLPLTKRWMDDALEMRRSLELVLEPLSSELSGASRSSVPSSMRSGVGWKTASSSAALPFEQWPEVHYISPVPADSWRAAFRVGLIHLVSAPQPVTSKNVPETLQLDVQRLHSVQNAFQRLVVTSAALLALQQVKQETIPHSTLLGMKSRLSAILEDPNVNLSVLTSELIKMADLATDVEPFINNTLINLINREKGGFRALKNGLTKALGISLVAGDSTEASSTKKAIQATLSTIGSSYLMEDITSVAHNLSLIAGINEAVHFQIYEGAL